MEEKGPSGLLFHVFPNVFPSRIQATTMLLEKKTNEQTNERTKMVHAERVIIDCDPGIDDAMAILLALASPELKVEGNENPFLSLPSLTIHKTKHLTLLIIYIKALTIVHGNHENVELLSQNARRILNLVNKQDIPVYIGARDPLMRPYHGRK